MIVFCFQKEILEDDMVEEDMDGAKGRGCLNLLAV